MTRLWANGAPVTVDFDRAGRPTAFKWEGRAHRIAAIHQQWRIESDWWHSDLVTRDYYAMTTSDGLLCVLFFDYQQQGFYLSRLYD